LQRKRETGLSDGEWMEWKALTGNTLKMKQLVQKRNNQVNAFFHRLSRMIVDEAVKRDIGIIVIGHNPGQKQEIDLGKVNNQNFTQLPIFKLIMQIKYKAEMQCIKIVEITEEFTSKASFLDGDKIPDRKKCKKKTNGHSDVQFSGKRGPRGLYTSKDGTIIHSDVNGACNIMRKAFPEAITVDGIGVRLHPEIRDIPVS
jgi:IS605 OrfB family transposase